MVSRPTTHQTRRLGSSRRPAVKQNPARKICTCRKGAELPRPRGANPSIGSSRRRFPRTRSPRKDQRRLSLPTCPSFPWRTVRHSGQRENTCRAPSDQWQWLSVHRACQFAGDLIGIRVGALLHSHSAACVRWAGRSLSNKRLRDYVAHPYAPKAEPSTGHCLPRLSEVPVAIRWRTGLNRARDG